MPQPFIHALAGGALIGAAAGLLLLLNGHIAGVSGIFGHLVRGNPGPHAWRLAFILGLVAAPVLYRAVGWPLDNPVFAGGFPLAITAGLLTGFGTALGGGCTSGHGVCGLSNLSLRSLVATLTFMFVAGLTVFIVRHIL